MSLTTHTRNLSQVLKLWPLPREESRIVYAVPT